MSALHTGQQLCAKFSRLGALDHQVVGMVEAHEVSQRGSDVVDQLLTRLYAIIQVDGFQDQGVGATIQLGIKATDQPVMVQDWQAEVAPDAFRSGSVSLQVLVKAPQLLVAAARPEQAVEGAEEGGALSGERPVCGLLEQGQQVTVDDPLVGLPI